LTRRRIARLVLVYLALFLLGLAVARARAIRNGGRSAWD
jgi:hypothetical protein